MKIRLKKAVSVRGIYAGGVMPARALWLEPEAATALERLETATGGLAYSDMYRSAEASLLARQQKNGVQRPSFSAHNYGLAVDVAVDDYVVPGTSGPKLPGCLTRLGVDYAGLCRVMGAHGWWSYRSGGTRGFEEWHFNYLGTFEMHGSAAAEHAIARLHSGAFSLSAVEVQTALTKLGLYRGAIDGSVGPLTKAAIGAFQRAWMLTAGPADEITQRTLAFVAAEYEYL